MFVVPRRDVIDQFREAVNPLGDRMAGQDFPVPEDLVAAFVEGQHKARGVRHGFQEPFVSVFEIGEEFLMVVMDLAFDLVLFRDFVELVYPQVIGDADLFGEGAHVTDVILPAGVGFRVAGAVEFGQVGEVADPFGIEVIARKEKAFHRSEKQVGEDEKIHAVVRGFADRLLEFGDIVFMELPAVHLEERVVCGIG